jgi:outer membrane lipoprotein-sorting protein
MNCLSPEQLAALAMLPPRPDDLVAEQGHVAQCAECAAKLRKLQQQFSRLENAVTCFEHDHESARQRLLTALADIAPASSRPGLTQTLKGVLTMRRTWIGSAVAAALVFALFFFLNGTGGPPLLAQTAKALRDMRSYECRVTFTLPLPDGKKAEMISKMYWTAAGSLRTDMYKGDKVTEVRILHKDKPGMEIDHRYETYSMLDPAEGERPPLLLMGKLARYSGQADRTLEKRKINGETAPGFEIAMAKVDPDAGEGTIRLWTDPKTALPLRVEIDMGTKGQMVWDGFRWNVPSDKWFDVKPPDSYQDKTPTPPDVEKMTKEIVAALKTFAKYGGGQYPQVKMVYGDVTRDELFKNAGLPARGLPSATDKELLKTHGECMKATLGFATINTLQRKSRDAVYHGKTVGPEDKDKVLFRWKLNDGRFRVIFGDLHVKDVTAGEVKKLEAK